MYGGDSREKVSRRKTGEKDEKRDDERVGETGMVGEDWSKLERAEFSLKRRWSRNCDEEMQTVCFLRERPSMLFRIGQRCFGFLR